MQRSAEDAPHELPRIERSIRVLEYVLDLAFQLQWPVGQTPGKRTAAKVYFAGERGEKTTECARYRGFAAA